MFGEVGGVAGVGLRKVGVVSELLTSVSSVSDGITVATVVKFICV